MEYEIGTFTQRLIDLFVSSKQLPNMHGEYTNRFGYTQSDSTKHKKRPDPKDLKYRIQQCINDTKTRIGDNQFMFDLGNEFMEENFPYYHILQQAPVIRKKGYGTVKIFAKETTKWYRLVVKCSLKNIHEMFVGKEWN